MSGLVCHTSEGFAATLLTHLPSAVVVTEADGTIVCWNRMAEKLYGYLESEVLGTPLSALRIGPTDKEEGRAVIRAVLADGAWAGEYSARCADGSSLRLSASVARISDRDRDFDGFVGISVDISDRAEVDERLAYEALHDPLTGLPNRRLFVDHVEYALARNGRSGELTAVVVIDLDDFKGLNERLGHDAADDVLRKVATVVTAELRTGDLVARLGGDEFFVCCDDVGSREEACQLAERIGRALQRPFDLGGLEVEVSASIGVAVAGAATGPEAMMRNAYAAMYAAKRSVRGAIAVFDDAVHEANRLRSDQVRELQAALDAGDVKAYFQPQVSLTTGAIVGFEALARWTHAVRGPISPAEFIAVAEDGGLIDALGLHMLRLACAAARRWNEAAEHEIPVAINVSAHQLADPSFPETVRGIIEAAGIPARLVCLELTESALVDADVASVAFAELKAVGVELALDDFGTGFSSLNRLHRFPLDWVKIDHGFVRGMMSRTEDAIIVSAVVSLARALGLRTVGEGVEDVRQLEQLVEMGCDVGQGFLWSCAVPADHAVRMVEVTIDTPSALGTADRLASLSGRPAVAVPDRPDHLLAGHRVQLYDEDNAIVATVADVCSDAAAAGHAILLVATPEHREAVAAELASRGVTVEPSSFHALDADLTLRSLLVGGEPDPGRFEEVVGSLVRGLATEWPGVSIYGEMVGILWEQGRAASATRLEDLWNELSKDIDFSLLCGYRLEAGAEVSQFSDVCRLHTGVIARRSPAELSAR